jgi:ABC-type transport system involved in multi-copper enzyme maturation permease subunit
MFGRLYVISNITYGQTVRQQIYYIIVFASALLLFLAAPFSLFSFGQELSMFREVGLATITFAGIILAVLSTDFVVASDIEKQTVLLTLTKPLRRSEFIIGKFIGISAAVFVAMFFLALVLLFVYWFKEGVAFIDSGMENGYYLKKGGSYIWKDTFSFLKLNGVVLFQGVYASFLMVTIIAAVAVTVSLFFSLPIMAGSIILVFIIGNISPYIYLSMAKKSSFLAAIPAHVFYTFIPNFTDFNLSSQVSRFSPIIRDVSPGMILPNPISWGYLFWITLYAVIWNALLLLVANMAFSKREIR